MWGSFEGSIAGMLSSNACFIAGTVILTNVGKIAIENIEEGMLVWAKNTETGEEGFKEVLKTFENETDELVHLFVGGEEIITTPEHPFYVKDKGFIGAIHLRAGDILVLVNGQYAILEKIQHEILEAPIKVYNFEVEGYHTYFVGDCAVLVHNACFRDKVQKATNMDGIGSNGEKLDAHHVFPEKFNNDFKALGFDNQKGEYGSFINQHIHRSFSYEYNQDWHVFLHEKNNKLIDRSQDEILDYGRMMAEKYDFDIWF